MGDNVTACVILLSYQDDDDDPASHGPARMSYGATSEMLREVPTDDVSEVTTMLTSLIFLNNDLCMI